MFICSLQAQYQATSLGLWDVAQVFVRHPISDQTREQIHARADEALCEIVAALTTNTSATTTTGGAAAAPTLLRAASEAEVEECGT
jgi:hypothetical protein